MSYYQGDFRGQGGFYRGDPGFFSFIGGLAKSALGFIPGVGPLLSAGAGAIIPTGSKAIVRAAPGVGKFAATMRGAGAMVAKHPVMSAAGAAATIAGAGALAGRAMAHPALAGRGFHIEKRGKHAGQLIKNRRMNPYNPRALRRAVRRAHAFSRMAVKILRFTHPHKAKGRPYFAKKRRRAA